MAARLHEGSEKRRSTRHLRRFNTKLEYGGMTYEVRTIDISLHGVLIPRRMPPPIGTNVKVILTIRGESSAFEGTIKRHTKSYVNGVQTTAIGIDFPSPEYEKFVRDRILTQ